MGNHKTVLYISQMLADNRIIELTDGSRWQISEKDFKTATAWVSGHQIALIDGFDDLFPHRLINLDCRDQDIITATRLNIET